MKRIVKFVDMKAQLCAFLFALAAATIFVSASVLADDLKPEIQQALDKGDTTTAIQLIRKDIELDKSFYLNYYTLGQIFYNREQYDKAKEQLVQAVDHKGKHWPSLYALGLTYIKLNKLDSAAKVMDDGRKKAKDEAHMFENGYGLVMMAQKNYAEADKSFRKALVAQPKNTEYRLNLGDANFYQGVPSLAAIEYEQALKDNEGSLEVYYHWAEACIEMKDYNCALEKLKLVLEKDSTHADAWLRAGSIYFKAALSSRTREERLGRFKGTIDAYERAIKLTGNHPDSSNVRAYYEIGLAYLQIYEFDSAAIHFQEVLNIPYEPRDIYFNYGKALWGTRDYEKSGEMLLKHLEIQKLPDPPPTNATDLEVNQLLGDSYFYRKPPDITTAIDYYKRALAIDSTQKRLVYNIALGYHNLKSYEQAIEYYQKRLDLGVDSSVYGIYRNAGLCALNLAQGTSGGGDDLGLDDDMPAAVPASTMTTAQANELAANYFDQYLQYVPGDTTVLALAGNTFLYQLKNCEKGVKYFSALLEVSPNNCEAQKALGFAYFGGLCTKNYAKAINYLTEAYGCDASMKKDVDLALWIAQAYHLQAADKVAAKQKANEEFKHANEWYTKVLALQPSNSIAKKGKEDTQFEF